MHNSVAHHVTIEVRGINVCLAQRHHAVGQHAPAVAHHCTRGQAAIGILTGNNLVQARVSKEVRPIFQSVFVDTLDVGGEQAAFQPGTEVRAPII